MLKKRLIAVLIVRDGRIVQSVRFKHTNVIHADAVHAMSAFNKWSVDEIVLLNVTREADSRDGFREVVESVSRHCFVPLAVGGWVTDEDYAQALLRSGADKLVVNTILQTDPALVTRLSERYGRQCIVASMDIKKDEDGEQKVAIDRGRQLLAENPVDWAVRAQKLGAGELFFNSIDHDGARRGYDITTLEQLAKALDIPLIAMGGVFSWGHLVAGIEAGASAAAAANQFHYTEQATRMAKSYMAEMGVDVRNEGRRLA